MTQHDLRMPLLRLAACLAAATLSACGGGGGGGGEPPGGKAADSVRFLGFSFRVDVDGVPGVPFNTPPFEDLLALPPTLGAPLDLVLLFRFDGVPAGPYQHGALPVFTTPEDVTPEALALPGALIPAKGSYLLDGNTVEFHPFVPTAPLSPVLSSPPEAVPGLLPASVYTAQVSTLAGTALSNLEGAGGEVRWGTTSNPSAYYSTGSTSQPPQLVQIEPADGTQDVYPGPYSNQPYGSTQPTYVPGSRTLRASYDRAVAPTAANLDGDDRDGDGAPEASFFLRARGTPLLVSLHVPAGVSFQPSGEDFPALMGLEVEPGGEEWRAWRQVAPDGSDLFVHADTGGTLPEPDPALASAPVALACGRDPSLLWLVFGVDGGPDRLGLADPVLGDPSGARLAPAALDTGLQQITALATLQDGRLVCFDRASGRLVELLPQVQRGRPVGTPTLTGLQLGDGSPGGGFRSEPLVDGLDLAGLGQAPSGKLYALVADGGSSVLRLHPIDPNLDGVFEPAEGTATGEVALSLSHVYAGLVFVEEGRALSINRSLDRVDLLDLAAGTATPVLQDLAAYGVALSALPDGLSPARALAAGFLDLDLDVSLLQNDASGAVVRLDPLGPWPAGRQLEVMQRQAFASLAGVSLANQAPGDPGSVLGAVRLARFTTALPDFGTGVGDPTAAVDDVFLEEFLDDVHRDPAATAVGAEAEWARLLPGGSPSGVLRASVGASASTTLGDFLPVASPNFDPDEAFKPGTGAAAHWTNVFLDTNAQQFPMPDGSTPGVSQNVVVAGGVFAFDAFVIPEGVRVIVRGDHPLRITATGNVRIDGILEVAGSRGLSDDSFDTGFVPVPGGVGGPGAGRGGDSHPSVWNPAVLGTLDQYATPEAAQNGFGPSVTAAGTLLMLPLGGRGGAATAGYQPLSPDNPAAADHLYPKVPTSPNEFHRPPGGGGGSFFQRGLQAHNGAGDYRVQSSSSWTPFTLCNGNDGIRYSKYGNEENRMRGLLPASFVQCLYRTFQPIQPGGLPGKAVFVDGDPANDYFGVGGELSVLVGGQGGGGGGTRVDSVDRRKWSLDHLGTPVVPPAPAYYPKLLTGTFMSPTRYDAKGGGGGGGGGTVRIRGFGDIVVGRTGHIDASGGDGGAGEEVGTSSRTGGGGGGSGGAILLQAAGEILIQADPGHLMPWWRDADDGDQGAGLNVSGGMGRDAPGNGGGVASGAPQHDFSRSDGGQGGFGLIQLQEGSADGMPTVEQGAFLFARQRAVLKLGPWTGDGNKQHAENGAWANAPPHIPDALRYVDMLHYRYVDYLGNGNASRFLVLNGSYPPIIQVTDPSAVGPHQLDTAMMDYHGRSVVREPEPNKVMRTYLGWDEGKFTSKPFQPWTERLNRDFGIDDPPLRPGGAPGTLYHPDDSIPLSLHLNEPDGTPIQKEIDGVMQFDPDNLVDRLPVIHPSRLPRPFGEVSRATSTWLDFNAVSLRGRDLTGRAPPFFMGGLHGTYNQGTGSVPEGKDGQVVALSPVPGKPARWVDNTPGHPFDPTLGLDPLLFPDQPFNDVKVNAPDIGTPNAVTDNATVSVLFQGAFGVRAGSHVPDPAATTAWLSDLSALSGYPLVRFTVIFDLDVNPALPFGPDSMRPAVDRVRIRTRY